MDMISDDELQKKVEEGASPSQDRDFLAYKRVFDILGEKHPFTPTGMEEAVISRIEHTRRRSVLREHAWLAAGLVFLMLGGVIAVAISGVRISLSGWQRNIMMLGICGGLVIIGLNTLERKLLNRQPSGRH